MHAILNLFILNFIITTLLFSFLQAEECPDESNLKEETEIKDILSSIKDEDEKINEASSKIVDELLDQDKKENKNERKYNVQASRKPQYLFSKTTFEPVMFSPLGSSSSKREAFLSPTLFGAPNINLFSLCENKYNKVQCQENPCVPNPHLKSLNRLLVELNGLFTEKDIERSRIINRLTGKFISRVLNIYTSNIPTLVSQIQAQNNTLVSTLKGTLGSLYSSELADIINEISTQNSELLTQINQSVANSFTESISLLTALALEPAATIVSVVTDLSSPAGLFSQLLIIASEAYGSLGPILYNITLNKILDINDIVGGYTADMGDAIYTAVQNNKQTLINFVKGLIANNVSDVIKIFREFSNELKNETTNFLDQLGNEVWRIVKNELNSV